MLFRMHFHCSLSNVRRLHGNGVPALSSWRLQKLLIVCKSMSKVVISLLPASHIRNHILFFLQPNISLCFMCACILKPAHFSQFWAAVIKQLQSTPKRNACNSNLISFRNSTTHPTKMGMIRCHQRNYET